jgi:hypothetical protein
LPVTTADSRARDSTSTPSTGKEAAETSAWPTSTPSMHDHSSQPKVPC